MSSPFPRARRRAVLLVIAAAVIVGGVTSMSGAHAARQDSVQDPLQKQEEAPPGQGTVDDPIEGETSSETTSGTEPTVDILQVSGPIDPPVAAALNDLLTEANERGSEAVVVQLDSPAGVAVDVREVVDPIRASEVPVIVWVGPGDAEAKGAAAFLHAAAHVPAMTTAATIGPACPVTVSSDDCSSQDRGLLAEIIDARADDGEAVAARLAEAAVGADDLTDVGYLRLPVDGLEPLLVELNGVNVTTQAGLRPLQLEDDEVTVRFHSLGLLRRTLHATLSPTFVYLLIVGALVLLLFEAFQPGFGVAGVAGVLLLPLAVYGIVVLPVAWWALALLVVGLVLLAADLAIAGLGPLTIAGTAATAAGSWWLYAADAPLLRLSPWVVAGITLACVIFFVPVMTVVLRAQAGPDLEGVGDDLVGKVGVVRSAMNPEGHVFVAGALWRARWTGDERGKIKTGTRVRVHGSDGAVVLVDDPDARGADAARDTATGANP